MRARSLLVFLFATGICTIAGRSGAPSEDVGARDQSPLEEAGADACATADSEESCLAREEGCAWGDRGNGAGCFFVGSIGPQPGSGDPGGGAGRVSGRLGARVPVVRRPPRIGF